MKTNNYWVSKFKKPDLCLSAQNAKIWPARAKPRMICRINADQNLFMSVIIKMR
jgi:hypothetical protein